MTKAMKFLREENGAAAVEYGLIAAMIAVPIISAMGNIGHTLDSTFNTIREALDHGVK